jgi:hypothetical protein
MRNSKPFWMLVVLAALSATSALALTPAVHPAAPVPACAAASPAAAAALPALDPANPAPQQPAFLAVTCTFQYEDDCLGCIYQGHRGVTDCDHYTCSDGTTKVQCIPCGNVC